MPSVALTSPTQAAYANVMAGPLVYGAQFGLHATKKNFTTFESSDTAAQAFLAGKYDVICGSTTQLLLMVARGAKMKIFAPIEDASALVIAAKKSITSLDQLNSSKVKTALDNPGGSADAVFDSILLNAKANFLSTDLPNKQILGSSGLRVSALAAGQIDATIIETYQVPDVQKQNSGVHVLATGWESAPKLAMISCGANSDWITKHNASAVALTASILKANSEFSTDLDAYSAGVKAVISEPPPASELEATFEIAQKNDFWPADGGLKQDNINFMIDLAVKEGILKDGEVTYQQAVETDTRDAALKKL